MKRATVRHEQRLTCHGRPVGRLALKLKLKMLLELNDNFDVLFVKVNNWLRNETQCQMMKGLNKHHKRPIEYLFGVGSVNLRDGIFRKTVLAMKS